MQKNTVFGIAALLIIVGGIIFYAAMKTAPGVEAPALTGSSYVEHAPYYDIAANYASSTSLGSAADAAAVARMKKFVSDTVVQFKADGNFPRLTASDAQTMGLGPDRKEKLQISYLIASSPRSVSYIYSIYEDALGAHGNTFFKTFTFDTSTGAEVSLGDLFVPGGAYLTTLSSLARAKLPSIIGDAGDADFIQSGTTPDEKNFESFFLDNGSLVILFPPYQVAPYAAGPQTLRISRSELANILKLEYQ